MKSIGDAVGRRWRAWRGAAPEARRDVLAMTVLVATLHPAVALLGYARVARWASATRGTTSDESATALTQRGADAVTRLRAYGLVRGNCLSRSLALQRWLSVRGVTTEVRFGVRPEAAGIAAHAWLEFGGTPLTDVPDIDTQFAPLGRG